MKVLALLFLLLAPLLVSSTTYTFLSGRRYNANVLSREADRGIQSTVVQIRGGGIFGRNAKAKTKAPSKSTNKKSAPSAPAAKKKKKFSIDFRERKVQIGLLASLLFCYPILTS
jgi:hypothetical protein